MKVLVVGGAGKVGSIIRSGLEAAHECRFFDRVPVAGAEQRTLCGDVTSDEIRGALDGQDAVIYLARGLPPEQSGGFAEIESHFAVNVLGWYSTLKAGLSLGIRRWVYASSFSVYRNFSAGRCDEHMLPDAWHPYGMSMRLAENVCLAGAATYPDATVVALRLVLPCTAEEWGRLRATPRATRAPADTLAQAPDDVARLFLAALACETRGAHVVPTSGDRTGQCLPNDTAAAVLGWRPQESLED